MMGVPFDPVFVEQKMKEAKMWIENNYTLQLPIRAMRATSGISTTAFTHHFKLYTGKTPKDYVHHVRMVVAEKMLTEGKGRICDMPEVLGYCDTTAFYRIFKKTFGMTPLHYRQRQVLRKRRLPGMNLYDMWAELKGEKIDLFKT